MPSIAVPLFIPNTLTSSFAPTLTGVVTVRVTVGVTVRDTIGVSIRNAVGGACLDVSVIMLLRVMIVARK